MGEDASNKSPPLLPSGWMSGKKLHDSGFIGGTRAIDRKLKALRSALVEDLAAAGFSSDDAIAIVDDNLVGLRKPRHGRVAIYGSPEAVPLLGLQRREPDDTPRAPPGWLSGRKLRHQYLGDGKKMNDILRVFRSNLIESIVQAGLSETEAEAIVDQNLVGLKITHEKGKKAMHASPDAIFMIEREGLLTVRNEQQNRNDIMK